MYYKRRHEAKKKDGIAIFFKKDKFTALKRYYINLLIQPGHNYNAEDELIQMNYPVLGLFLLLKGKPIKDGLLEETFLIVSTHIVFKEYLGHVKLAMLVFILKTVEKIKAKHTVDHVLFSGDFNFTPNSMLYDFLAGRDINLDCSIHQFSNQYHLDRLFKGLNLKERIRLCDKKFKLDTKEAGGPIDGRFADLIIAADIILPDIEDEEEVIIQRPNEVSTLSRQQVIDELKLLSKLTGFQSAYAAFHQHAANVMKNGDDIDQLKNYDPFIKEANNDSYITQLSQDLTIPVDYVWFSSKYALRPVGVLEAPDVEFLEALGYDAPIGDFGSDHFNITVDFGYIDSK